MKIINLYAVNLKRLTPVQISPDGNLVQITGKNGQGKTSVLDAIWWALAGTSNVQTTPIRKGEERAIITLDLGKLKITRRFNAQDDGSYTTSITVENDEGARFSSPQGMLDKLLGELTFDPLAFTRMKDQDQVLALRSLVPDYDFEEAERLNKADFSERTDVNREAKAAKASAEEMSSELPEVIPERVSQEDLMSEWQEAASSNQAMESRAARRKGYVASRDEIADRIAEMEKTLQEHNEQINSWDDLPEPIDADSIKAKLDTATDTNKIVDRAELCGKLSASAKGLEARSEKLTSDMQARKDAARDAIAKADMPVSGLSIDDGVVNLDGIPFNQASDAHQLQASIGIAMALNPTLKVIRVRDGSLLDEDAMKVLTKMADSSDYQIWIERVDSSGTVGFVLEDGHIKGQEIVLEPKPEKSAKMPERLQAVQDAKWEATKGDIKPAPSLFDKDRE